ncbi:alfa-L-arabinofuranosidase precursor [Rickenella mellea]|uniref:non-reducing end alpha-L-arabinofuranosidase n=1 Tax=Rickenella mellea TaxID=50990 RepID=A0A4Y7PUW0_9AGAM|nr:alfa-L-arabinofuranosidase precursor [Rickenella mellea]
MLFIFASILSLIISGVVAQNLTITINGTASHPIPTTMYGWMWEDINHNTPQASRRVEMVVCTRNVRNSYYTERQWSKLFRAVLQNRAFQQVTPKTSAALYAWSSFGATTLTVVDKSVTPSLSTALPNSLQVQVAPNASGQIGVSNSGYFGINVNPAWTYTGSFYYKVPAGTKAKGQFLAALRSSSGAVLASKSITLNPSATSWTQVTFNFKPIATPADNNNVFTLTVDGASTAGQTIFFSMFSLFPPTFKNRPNGMRIDLAEALQATKPGFFRFPGGNNLGQSIAGRWNWRNTVGPLINRPGRLGDWTYINTDGLGLKEYLDFLEDVGMPSIMAIWAGYSFGGTVPENQMAQYIQEASDQINFVIGDPAKSAAAALRASLGHPAPYPLVAVEVGNEDFFASDTYSAYRWPDIVGNLSAQFPSVQFMATTNVGSPVLKPKPKLYDVHVYQTPTWFAQNSFIYDSFPRDGTKYFEVGLDPTNGEFAAISTNPNDLFGAPSDGRLLWPTVAGTVGEAAFMTGLERNADIVFAASYAPLLQHINGDQWTPDLISFDAKNVYKSTSYYMQQMFSLNKGDEYLPSTLPSKTGTVFWSVTRRIATKEVLIKISNTGSASSSLTFKLPFNTVSKTGSATVLSGAQNASNTPTAPNTVVPKSSSFTAAKTFTYNVPGFSVHVLSVVAS